MHDEAWARIARQLPEMEAASGSALAVAFIDADAYARRRGQARLWWPGSAGGVTTCVDFDGRFPDDWGLLLVMNEVAIEKVGAGGTAVMAHLARQLDIKPFVLRQRDDLESGGVLEVIENLELATPKH